MTPSQFKDSLRNIWKQKVSYLSVIVIAFLGVATFLGISFSDAVGAVAYITYIRAILLRDTGSSISPFHAFISLQGLETLSLRVERHVSNALEIVTYLSSHPQVEAVHHP